MTPTVDAQKPQTCHQTVQSEPSQRGHAAIGHDAGKPRFVEAKKAEAVLERLLVQRAELLRRLA
jgi:hypothetical protein